MDLHFSTAGFAFVAYAKKSYVGIDDFLGDGESHAGGLVSGLVGVECIESFFQRSRAEAGAGIQDLDADCFVAVTDADAGTCASVRRDVLRNGKRGAYGDFPGFPNCAECVLDYCEKDLGFIYPKL